MVNINTNMAPIEVEFLIIGAGPGGTAVAERLSILGAKNVTIVEKGLIGGICVNQGCIPIHFALQNLLLKHQITERNFRDQLFTNVPDLKLPELKSAIEGLKRKIRSGIKKKYEANGVIFIEGMAKVKKKNMVEITREGVIISRLTTQDIIIAAGATYESLSISGAEDAKDAVIGADQVMSLESNEIPKSVIVYGLDSPAVEVAAFFHLLGSDVTFVSPHKKIVSFGSKQLRQTVEDMLEVRGIMLYKNVKLRRFSKSGMELTVEITEQADRKRFLSCDLFINAFHKRPNLKWVKGLPSEIPTENIHFLGDAREERVLPHRSYLAAFEGRLLADRLMKKEGMNNLNSDLILHGIATVDLQAATIGLTEEEAIKRGIKVKILKFPNARNAYAQILGQISGYTMLIADGTTKKILGGEIVGVDALNLITIIGTAIACDGRLENLKKLPAFHPSLSEGIFECAWLK